jgi:hypothetical protein
MREIWGKRGLTVIAVFGAALAADRFWNYGYYSDSALITLLREIKRSFGW